MDGVRVGNKNIKSTVPATVKDMGSFGECENSSKHSPKNSNTTGGQGVYGMPLFSEAAKVVENKPYDED
jgi:hypothetical protein